MNKWLLIGGAAVVLYLISRRGGVGAILAGGGGGRQPGECAPPGYLDANGNCVMSPPRLLPDGGVFNCIQAPCFPPNGGGVNGDGEADRPWWSL